MSILFGPVIQQGYIVPDIEQAMQHWIARGVGPFFLEHHQRFPASVDGQECEVEFKAAFAYSGEQQIEMIQPMGDTPTVYTEFLAQQPRGGLQHLAVWVDEIDDKMRELNNQGAKFVVRQRYRKTIAYVDSVDQPGVMIQLMARTARHEALFAIVREGADTWDGSSEPVRHLDWSTGMPQVQAS